MGLLEIPEDGCASFLIPAGTPSTSDRIIRMENIYESEDGVVLVIDMTIRVPSNTTVRTTTGQTATPSTLEDGRIEYTIHKDAHQDVTLEFIVPGDHPEEYLEVEFDKPIVQGGTSSGFVYENFIDNTFDEPWSNASSIEDIFNTGLFNDRFSYIEPTGEGMDEFDAFPGIPGDDLVNISSFINNALLVYFNYSGGQNTCYYRNVVINPVLAKDLWVKYQVNVQHWEKNNRFLPDGSGEYGARLLLGLVVPGDIDTPSRGMVVDLTRVSRWFYGVDIDKDIIRQDPQIWKDCFITGYNEVAMKPFFVNEDLNGLFSYNNPGDPIDDPISNDEPVKRTGRRLGTGDGNPIDENDIIRHCALAVNIHSNFLRCTNIRGSTGQIQKITSDTLVTGRGFTGHHSTQIVEDGVVFTVDNNSGLFKYDYADARVIGRTISTQTFQWNPGRIHYFNGHVYFSSTDFWSSDSITYKVCSKTLNISQEASGLYYNSFASIDDRLFALYAVSTYNHQIKEINPATLGVRRSSSQYSGQLRALSSGPNGYLYCRFIDTYGTGKSHLGRISPSALSMTTTATTCSHFCHGPDSTGDEFIYAVDDSIVKKINPETMGLVASYDCGGRSLVTCQFHLGHVYVSEDYPSYDDGWVFFTIWKIKPDDMSYVAAKSNYTFRMAS